MSRRKLLVDAVKLLALDATVQLANLGERGLLPAVDELVLEFDDIAGARNDMLEMGELNADEHRAVAMLDAVLDEVLSPADEALWTPEAVKHDVRWAETRRLAVQCLQALRRGAR